MKCPGTGKETVIVCPPWNKARCVYCLNLVDVESVSFLGHRLGNVIAEHEITRESSSDAKDE